MRWVPTTYCQYVIESDSFGAGKLFCYLKHNTDGLTSKVQLRDAGDYFGVSDRTIRRWYNRARAENWIGESKAGTLFLRSWQHIMDIHGFQFKTCFRFRESDLHNFKTYCYAAVISNMARSRSNQLERLSGRSIQADRSVPLASNAIAKTLNVSERTAQTYRQKAVESGYIQKTENLKPFNVKVIYFNQFMKSFPEANLTIRNGQVFEQLPDKVHYHPDLIRPIRRLKVFSPAPPAPPEDMYAKNVHYDL